MHIIAVPSMPPPPLHDLLGLANARAVFEVAVGREARTAGVVVADDVGTRLIDLLLVVARAANVVNPVHTTAYVSRPTPKDRGAGVGIDCDTVNARERVCERESE